MSIPGIEALTVPALATALDAATLRQQVAAHNIANASTQSFRAQRVSFDVALDTAAGTGASPGLQLHPHLALAADSGVRLDAEVAAMAQNGLHYQALLRALNRHLAVLSSAVSDGKR